jgi:hypothetical protein
MVPVFGAFIALIIIAGRVHNARLDVDAAAAQAARTITMSDDPGGQGQADARAVARDIAMEGSPTCADFEAVFDQGASVGGREAVNVLVICQVDLSEMTALPVPGQATVIGEATEVFDEFAEDAEDA